MTDAQDIVGLDAVDLEMIQRGDMLGPSLGAKTFAVLVAKDDRIKELEGALRSAKGAVYGWHEQGFIMEPLIDPPPLHEAIAIMAYGNKQLEAALRRIIKASDENTGNEPSLSVFDRAIDLARDLLE